MTSVRTLESTGHQPAAEKSQYHHFIPQFLLRDFAQNRLRKKDGLLRLVDTEDGALRTKRLSRHYGIQDMYRDMYAAEQHGLEKKFSRLEGQAAEVIRSAKTTFNQPGATLTLTRSEKDTLRRFLFLLKYRNIRFCSRFNVPTINEYALPDKQRLLKYMQARSFQSPREVWLANMHAFLDITIDSKRDWHKEIRSRSYPDDATLFSLHMEQSYMAFCKPKSADEEFLLTENVYGIFEGPYSFGMDPETGQLNAQVWTEWHNFAPVSPSLLIILRSNHLPGIFGEATPYEGIMYETLRSMHVSPEQAGSMLQDLPVKRCITSYQDSQSGIPSSDYQGSSHRDRYTFECFGLQSAHVDMINNIFIEEAISATSIVFKKEISAARAIRSYLEDPRPGFKTVSHNSDRKTYLNVLETALQNLNSKANTVCDVLIRPVEEQHPLDYAGHWTRWATFYTASEICLRHPELLDCYRMLGGSSTRSLTDMEKWHKDVEQAGKIAFLTVKFDTALSAMGCDRISKLRCRMVRHGVLAALHPRYIWLYVKAMRNLDKLDQNDFSRLTKPLQCEGVEDEMVRRTLGIKYEFWSPADVWLGRMHTHPAQLSDAMLRTVGQT